MRNIKIYFTLLLFLFTITGHSQNISNGYYNCLENRSYIYVYNDTIILPYYGGMITIIIAKGVIDNKRKWINFIPIEHKDRHPDAIYGNKKQKRMKFKYSEEDQRIEILFNFPSNHHWNKYVKTEVPHDIGRGQQAIEKHINDMKKE